MAVYGRDFYGLVKYGADVYVFYNVEPFEAQPDGYGAVRLSWSLPSGTWTQMRMLKNRHGYAVNINDGEVLFDSTTPVTYWTDSNLTPGAWYYYTLYLKVDGTWHRVGVTSSLVVKDFGFAGLLWDRIPHYFHWVPRYPDGRIKTYFHSAEVYDPDRLDQVNQHLQQFLHVLAWGFDLMRSYSDTTLLATNAKTTHLENLDRLARTLGTVYEYEVPARVMRSKVANTALLARSRGTLPGLRDVAALSSGYDVEIEVGPNMFLNEDQGNFANPIYDEWDAATNYPTGHRVQYSGRIVQAQTGGAYGEAERPPDAPATSNTWWQVITAQVAETLRDTSTGAISTWKMFRADGMVQETIQMAVGASSPVDTTVASSNSLYVKNANASAKSYHVWGAANPTGTTTDEPLPLQAVKQGIPIPRPLLWDSAEEYQSGTLVVHGCRTFRAIRPNVGHDPDVFVTDWVKVGADERPRLAFSFYSHSDFDGSPGVAFTPGLAFFDGRGELIDELDTEYHDRGAFFDTFNGIPNRSLTTRTPDQQIASEQWEAQPLVDPGAPVRTNLVTNTSFEVNTTGWSSAEATLARVTTVASDGLASMSVTALGPESAMVVQSSSGTSGMPVIGGATYTVFARTLAATTPRFTRLTVEWFNAAGTPLGVSNGPISTNGTSSWSAFNHVVTAPATAAYASVGVVFLSVGGGEVHYVDAVRFEAGSTSGWTYFNGDTPDTDEYAYAWTGAAHASTSTATPLTVGAWNIAEPSSTERVAWPVGGTGVITVTMPVAADRYKVAVTFKRPGLDGHTQALVLRYVDTDNWLRVTRTGVEKKAAGTVTNLDTFDTPVADGDRVTVLMDEVANEQTVYINGTSTSVITGQPQPAGSVGSARYRHGLMVAI